MKVKWIFLGLICLCLATVTMGKDKGNRWSSSERLLRSIDKGVANGTLTYREADRLYAAFDDMIRYENRAWRDGRLSRKEGRKLSYMYEDLEKAIYRQKRDRDRQRIDYRSNYNSYDYNYDYDRNRRNRNNRNRCEYRRNNW